MSSFYSEQMNKKDKAKLVTSKAISYIFLILVAVMCLIFFYILFVNATKTDAENVAAFTLIPSTHFIDNFKTAITANSSSYSLGNAFINSLIIAFGSGFLSVYFSAMTAYGIHVYDFKLKNFAFTFILMIMMIPAQVTTLGFLDIVNKLKLTNNYLPLIIPAIAAPAVFFYMKQYMESAIPLEVVEAARVDGSNEFKTFNVIVLPMMKPALAVQMIFQFVASWNNLFLPNLLLSDPKMKTLPIVLSFLRGQDKSQFQDRGMLYMTIFISIIPVIIVYAIFSKFIIKGVTLGSVKG